MDHRRLHATWLLLHGPGRIVIVAVAMVFGFASGAQVRTALAIRSQLRILPERLEELAYELRQRERVRENLESQIQNLRGQAATYETAIAASQTQLAGLNQQLQRLRALAGLTELEGPGVVVEMDDSSRPLRPGEDPNEVILHNYDVVDIVNELWAAGAEAVAINGARLIATTPIKSVATTMMVNARRINPPLRIEAIGDPDALEAYLERRGGFVGLLRAYTFPVQVTMAVRLVIPPYRGALQFRFLAPADRSK